MRGRPSVYTEQIAEEICNRLAAGESLRSICKSDHLPVISTVCAWNIDNHHGFSEQYARARRMQAELLADELFSIADDGSNDWQETEKGRQFNQEAAQRSRLRVDTRKWYLSKVLPKIYGERVDLNHGSQPDNPLVLTVRGVDKE